MSQRPLFALSPWETLVSPIRAIRAGSWRLILFSSFLGAATLLLFHHAFKTWDEIANLLPIAPSAASGLKTLGRIGWFFAVPFLVTSVAAPIRIIWFTHSLSFKELFRETLPMIRRCWDAMRSTKIRFFISVIAIHQLIRLLGTGQPPEIILVFQLCIFAGFFLLFHWLFSVLVGTATNVGVLYGLQQSTRILKHKWWPALLVVLACGISSLLIRLWIHGVNFLSNASAAGEILIHSIVGWYGFSALCVLALEASEAHARSQGLTFRKELASSDE